jgi:hypothetical protein
VSFWRISIVSWCILENKKTFCLLVREGSHKLSKKFRSIQNCFQSDMQKVWNFQYVFKLVRIIKAVKAGWSTQDAKKYKSLPSFASSPMACWRAKSWLWYRCSVACEMWLLCNAASHFHLRRKGSIVAQLFHLDLFEGEKKGKKKENCSFRKWLYTISDGFLASGFKRNHFALRSHSKEIITI